MENWKITGIIATLVIVLSMPLYLLKQRLMPRGAALSEKGTVATFVGRDRCIECHREEHKRWQGSDHDKAMAMARKITNKPPEALRMAKRLIYMGQRMSMGDLLEQSATMQALCHHTEDHVEALNAFFDKREPEFKGK